MRVGARRSSAKVLFSGNANPGGCNAGELKRNVARNVVWPPAPDALRPGSGIGHGTPIGGLEKDAVSQCVIPGQAAMLGNRRGKRGGTQSGQWLRRKPSHRGNCATTMSVRSAVAVRPEQDESAVPLSVSSNYAAVMGKQPELVVRSNRVVKGMRSASTAPSLRSRRGKRFRGYRPGSSRHLLSVGLP